MTAPIANPAEAAVAALRKELGDNLHSVCLYGSAVRGGSVEGVSDLNLLIVLKVSDAAAHEAVARAIGKDSRIEPFILGLTGFERSVRAFAAKFASIQRWHRVLHGEDVLAGVSIPPALERFLCEQALRNLRLRMAHSFITRAQHRAYVAFLTRNATQILLRISEVLRLEGVEISADIAARVPVLAREFGLDATTLNDLVALKSGSRKWREGDAPVWHPRVFAVLDTVVHWIEARWSQQP